MSSSRFRISYARKKRFYEKLLTWYKKNSRDLPWRKTHDPYKILVSELMLQQTQVDRVIEKYKQWITVFPNVYVLSRMSSRRVIAEWQGLGYNRRALYLHRIAKKVVNEHSGKFPRTLEELVELPGIGQYTAGAIMSFAYNENTPILDTNVKRVLGRIFFGYKVLQKSTESELWELARTLTPKKDSYNYHQALMDFGSLVCTSKKPACRTCPLQRQCLSYPDILSASAEDLRYQPQAKETLYFGQPRRIWRGKILKYLHDVDSSGATYSQIGKAIQEDFSILRLQWLKDVVQTLEKDELVKLKKKRVYLP